MKFVDKKSLNIPLGLITVAALLPGEWNRRLVDTNVSRLRDKDIAWADLVFVTAMSVQHASVRQIIRRCKKMQTKIVAGGPLFTEEHELRKRYNAKIFKKMEEVLKSVVHRNYEYMYNQLRGEKKECPM